MFGLGTTELIIVLVIVVILFGSTRLPQIGKGIGEAIRNFKKSTSASDEIDVTPKTKADKSENSEAGKESKS